MTDLEFNEALLAAREERERQYRLLAKLDPSEPAQVPVPTAEHPEPTPYEKFGGCHYDDTLDPVSPNFDVRTWQ